MEFQYREVQTEEDIQAVFRIYDSNPEYFEMVSQKVPTLTDVQNDMQAMTDGIEKERKHYGIFFLENEVVAVTDILSGFPEDDIFYIGLFMIKGDKHRSGLGRRLFLHLEQSACENGFGRIRLGVVEGNQKGIAFWKNMGFTQIRTVEASGDSEIKSAIFVMEKKL